MAKKDNIIRLVDFPRGKDSAVAAKRRAAEAGADDSAFDGAIVDLEMLPATTLHGVLAKFELLRARIECLQDGDEMSAEGWAATNVLCDGIGHALQRFTARAVAI